MKELENLKELYLDEIKKTTKKGDLTPADGENNKKALEALILIEELCEKLEMKEQGVPPEMSRRMSYDGGYSTHYIPEQGRYLPEMNNAYPYYGDGYSERRGRNQRNGQYMSRDDGTVSRMLDQLETMRMDAPNEMTRRTIDRCIKSLETY